MPKKSMANRLRLVIQISVLSSAGIRVSIDLFSLPWYRGSHLYEGVDVNFS
jgi:hypothetical protein